MTPAELQRLEDLEQKIEELLRYVEDRKGQQLTYPLDQNTITLIQQA